MSAGTGAGGAAGAGAAAAMINAISTLPEAYPDEVGDESKKAERAWKRYLFYIIGYCDTYHDFADARNTVGEGSSLKLGVKGSVRARYVLDNIINAMDPIGFSRIHATIKGDTTFEKSMYSIFTELLDMTFINTLNETYKQQIKLHLSNIHSLAPGFAFQNILIEDGDVFFTDAGQAASNVEGIISDSSILELRIPAKVYDDPWQQNFIKFLYKVFPDSIEGGVLKIVEDTATFPRELFINYPENFKKFLKLDIPQTRWDPAGITNFNDKTMSNLFKKNGKVSAPSFRSLDTFSTNTDAQYLKSSAFFEQQADVNSLILPGQVPDRIDNLQRGPSVNHLFMHLILHSDLTPISTALGADTPANKQKKSSEIKRDAKRLINAANNPLKGKKTSTLKLEQGEVSDPRLLRKYTTSKRTGDYENTNGAKFHNAILFCGDEPEFVYAMLNEQPAIYHTHEAGGHKFRIYIPKTVKLSPEQKQIKQDAQTVTNYIHKAFELQRLFTNVKEFVKGFFLSIQEKFTSNLIFTESKKNIQIMHLFKYIICKIILNNEETIRQLNESYQIFEELNGVIKARLSKYNCEVLKISDFAQIKREMIEKLIAKVESIEGLREEIVKLDVQLAALLKSIPKSLNINEETATPANINVFKEVKTNPLFIINTAAGETRWNIQSPLFSKKLNSLNTIIPELIKSLNFINGQSLDETKLSRAIKVKMSTEKKKVSDLLTGFDIGEDLIYMTKENRRQIYSEAVDKFNELTSVYLEQQGGTRYTRKVNRVNSTKDTKSTKSTKHMSSTHRKKNKRHHTPRSQLLSKEIDLDKLRPTELYKYINKSIIKLGRAPFGLKPKEYANQIVFRMMIIDSINEITGGTSIAPIIPFKRSQEIKRQSGGALRNDEHLYWYRLYIDIFIPLWDTLHKNGSFSPRNSVVVSILNGSFIELVIPLLEEISTIQSTSPEIIPIIASAQVALEKICRIIDYSFKDSHYIFLRPYFTVNKNTINQEDLKSIINTREYDYFKFVNDEYHVTDRFTININTYISFLGNVLRCTIKKSAWTPTDETTIESELDAIGQLNEDNYEAHVTSKLPYINSVISLILQSHYRLFYQEIDGPLIDVNPIDVDTDKVKSSPSAAGGGPEEIEETEEEAAERAAEEAKQGQSGPVASGLAEGASESSGSNPAARGGSGVEQEGGKQIVKGHEYKKGKRRSSPRRLSLKNR